MSVKTDGNSDLLEARSDSPDEVPIEFGKSPRNVSLGLTHAQREIQISKIVKDSTASRKSAGNGDVVILAVLEVHLFV